jgi:hypothetical protein
VGETMFLGVFLFSPQTCHKRDFIHTLRKTHLKDLFVGNQHLTYAMCKVLLQINLLELTAFIQNKAGPARPPPATAGYGWLDSRVGPFPRQIAQRLYVCYCVIKKVPPSDTGLQHRRHPQLHVKHQHWGRRLRCPRPLRQSTATE